MFLQIVRKCDSEEEKNCRMTTDLGRRKRERN